MKNFFKKVFLFSLIPLIAGTLFILILDYQINNSYSEYQINPNISNIFVGDSHIQLAINDSIILRSLNLATNSESFYFSYYKLKMLLKKNNSIRHVYLGLSYHSLSNYYDRFISGSISGVTAPKYFYLLPVKEKIRMIYWNRTTLVPFIKSISKHGIVEFLNKDGLAIIGGFENSFNETAAVSSSIDKRIQFQFYDNGKLNPFSEFNIHYLNKIVSLCKTKGVEFTALNTPLHEYYYNQVPEEYKSKLNEIIIINQLNYIDLANLKLSDKGFIPDGDHVSFIGAEKTSIKLNEIIQEQISNGMVNSQDSTNSNF